MNNALITQTDGSNVEVADIRLSRRRWLPKAVVLLMILFIVGLVNASTAQGHVVSDFQHLELRP